MFFQLLTYALIKIILGGKGGRHYRKAVLCELTGWNWLYVLYHRTYFIAPTSLTTLTHLLLVLYFVLCRRLFDPTSPTFLLT
jgi:hypothetical protein